MRKQGVDILEDGFDIENHNINKKAANEAMRNVDRFQYVSDPNLQGEWYDPTNEDVRIAVKAFMPFSSFIMNEKTRNYIDASILASKTSNLKAKQDALTSLTGTVLEKIVFNSLGLGISTGTAYAALNLLGFYDEDEEKKKLENRIRGRAGNLVTDFFSPAQPLDPGLLIILNDILKNIDKPDDGQDPFQFFDGDNVKFFEQFGVFSITKEQGDVIADLYKINKQGKIGDYELNEAEKQAVKYLLSLSSLNVVGAVPSETASAINYVYDRLQDIAANAKSSGQTTTPMTKRQLEDVAGENIFKEVDEATKEYNKIMNDILKDINIF